MLDAFRTAAICTRDQIAQASRRHGVTTAAGRLLSAVVAQYDGDVDTAIRRLRPLVASGGAEGACAADVLAPILMMRGGREREIASLAAVLERCGWAASAAAFRAYLAVRDGSLGEARAQVSDAAALLEAEEDPVIRFRLEQRLARVAFFLHEYDAAIGFALAGAAGASRQGAWRAAAAAYSILYNIYADVTGDVEEAARYAGLWRIAASKSDDASFLHAALVAEFELAVQAADQPRIATLRDDIRRRLLPPQYAEHFALVLSEAMLRATSDLRAFASSLQVLRDAGERSRAERALCAALIGIAHAASFDDAAARGDVREAMHLLGRPRRSDPAFERRYRRLARAAVGVTCVLIGDNVRAARVVRTSEMATGQAERELAERALSGEAAAAPRSHRAFARLFDAAHAARRAAEPAVSLTPAEIEVLRLLAAGYGAQRIAHESGRSVNTIYNHTRSILAKFDAERMGEAMAIARRIGMLA